MGVQTESGVTVGNFSLCQTYELSTYYASFGSEMCIRDRRDSVGDVGYEGNINYELLLSLDPDLVLLYLSLIHI